MRVYVYYGYLSNTDYHKLADADKKVIVSSSDTSLSAKKERIKKKALDIGLNVTTVVVSTMGGAMPSGPNIPKNFSRVIQAKDAVITTAKSNPANTFYTGNDNFEINVNVKQLDLKHVKIYDDGKKTSARTWTDRLSASKAVAQAEKSASNPNNPVVPVMCYFISPTPPEVVHQQKKLECGLVTIYPDDVDRFFQALAENSPKFIPNTMEQHEQKNTFNWPDKAKVRIEPKDMNDLVDRIPNELLHVVDPIKLGIKDLEMNKNYQKIVFLYKDMVKRLEKGEKESMLKKFGRSFLSIVPFAVSSTYSDDDEKAFNKFQVELNAYKTGLKRYLSAVAVDVNVREYKSFIEKVIQGRTFIDTISRFDPIALKNITPEDWLQEFTKHEIYKIHLAELKYSYQELLEKDTPESLNNYRNKILETLISLQRSFAIEKQPTVSDQIDKTLQTLALKTQRPSYVTPLNDKNFLFSHVEIIEDYDHTKRKQHNSEKDEVEEDVNVDTEIKTTRSNPME